MTTKNEQLPRRFTTINQWLFQEKCARFCHPKRHLIVTTYIIYHSSQLQPNP